MAHFAHQQRPVQRVRAPRLRFLKSFSLWPKDSWPYLVEVGYKPWVYLARGTQLLHVKPHGLNGRMVPRQVGSWLFIGPHLHSELVTQSVSLHPWPKQWQGILWAVVFFIVCVYIYIYKYIYIYICKGICMYIYRTLLTVWYHSKRYAKDIVKSKIIAWMPIILYIYNYAHTNSKTKSSRVLSACQALQSTLSLGNVQGHQHVVGTRWDVFEDLVKFFGAHVCVLLIILLQHL